jgi:hypothetical protein
MCADKKWKQFLWICLCAADIDSQKKARGSHQKRQAETETEDGNTTSRQNTTQERKASSLLQGRCFYYLFGVFRNGLFS